MLGVWPGISREPSPCITLRSPLLSAPRSGTTARSPRLAAQPASVTSCATLSLAAGLPGDPIFILPRYENSSRLRIAAPIAAVLICLMTKSRMASLLVVITLIGAVSRLCRHALLAALRALSLARVKMAETA